MYTTTKTKIDAVKTASKKRFKKIADATADSIGNKTADKITSIGETKSNENEGESNKKQKSYIPPEKRQQVRDDLRLFWKPSKIEYQKILDPLDKTSDNVLNLLLKNGQKFMISLENYTAQTNK